MGRLWKKFALYGVLREVIVKYLKLCTPWIRPLMRFCVLACCDIHAKWLSDERAGFAIKELTDPIVAIAGRCAESRDTYAVQLRDGASVGENDRRNLTVLVVRE